MTIVILISVVVMWFMPWYVIAPIMLINMATPDMIPFADEFAQVIILYKSVKHSEKQLKIGTFVMNHPKLTVLIVVVGGIASMAAAIYGLSYIGVVNF
ncbi:hypothetical protein [Periweissella cryptocerci]|nr:hypothetical protein [Periweissella cryptocerci]